MQKRARVSTEQLNLKTTGLEVEMDDGMAVEVCGQDNEEEEESGTKNRMNQKTCVFSTKMVGLATVHIRRGGCTKLKDFSKADKEESCAIVKKSCHPHCPFKANKLIALAFEKMPVTILVERLIHEHGRDDFWDMAWDDIAEFREEGNSVEDCMDLDWKMRKALSSVCRHHHPDTKQSSNSSRDITQKCISNSHHEKCNDDRKNHHWNDHEKGEQTQRKCKLKKRLEFLAAQVAKTVPNAPPMGLESDELTLLLFNSCNNSVLIPLVPSTPEVPAGFFGKGVGQFECVGDFINDCVKNEHRCPPPAILHGIPLLFKEPHIAEGDWQGTLCPAAELPAFAAPKRGELLKFFGPPLRLLTSCIIWIATTRATTSESTRNSLLGHST